MNKPNSNKPNSSKANAANPSSPPNTLKPKRIFRTPDLILFAAVLMLLGVGVSMIYSASMRRVDETYFLNQLSAVGFGIGIMILFSYVSVNFLRRFSVIFLLVCVGLLILVLIPGFHTGNERSHRWLSLGFINFQPSELTKIALILYLASLLDRKDEKVKKFFTGVLPPLLLILIICVLIFIEPDFSTAAFIFLFSCMMFFIAGAKFKQLALLIALVIPLVIIVISTGYRGERLANWLNPEQNPFAGGNHYFRFQDTFSNGGWFGLGIGNGVEKLSLPEAHTDSIFAVYAEELGFIGSLAVLFLYGVIGYRGYQIAMRMQNKYHVLLAFGVTTLIMGQAVLNIGIAVGIFPITGLPLPFLSYGRTSIITLSVAMGLLLSLSKYVTPPIVLGDSQEEQTAQLSMEDTVYYETYEENGQPGEKHDKADVA